MAYLLSLEVIERGDLFNEIDSSEFQSLDVANEASIIPGLWNGLEIDLQWFPYSDKIVNQLKKQHQLFSNHRNPGLLHLFGITFRDDYVGTVSERVSSDLSLPTLLSHKSLGLARNACEIVQFFHSQDINLKHLNPSVFRICDSRLKLSSAVFVSSHFPSTNDSFQKYCAPELSNDDTSVAADIYSLGVLLYEMLSSRSFPSSDITLTFPSTFPNDLQMLIQSCIDPAPSKRPLISKVISVISSAYNNHVTKDPASFPYQVADLQRQLHTSERESKLLQRNNSILEQKIESLVQRNSNLSNELKSTFSKLESVESELSNLNNLVKNPGTPVHPRLKSLVQASSFGPCLMAMGPIISIDSEVSSLETAEWS
ncbi:hypothetical protein GEMRC1_000680 [Eukaryota sp. GEM-RC1]